MLSLHDWQDRRLLSPALTEAQAMVHVEVEENDDFKCIACPNGAEEEGISWESTSSDNLDLPKQLDRRCWLSFLTSAAFLQVLS